MMEQLTLWPVWDKGIRWFHWINVLCVLLLAALGLVLLNEGALGISNEGKLALKALHALTGYCFALNLIWRLIWAFIGNRHARWRAFLPGGPGYLRDLRDYLAAHFSPVRRQYLGHNPLARLSVTALLFLLTVQALTGLILAGTDLFYPPFGNWIAEWVAAPGVAPSTLVPYAPGMYDAAAYETMRAYRKPVVLIHEYNFYMLCGLIILHVAGVILTEVREGGSIISAMFTGKKTLDGKPEDG